MHLALSQLKRVVELELNPKETPVVRIPIFPILERESLGKGSELITPYILELIYDFREKEWITNLEL